MKSFVHNLRNVDLALRPTSARLPLMSTPFWLAGAPETGDDVLVVANPAGEPVANVAVPSDAQVERAVAAAHAVRRDMVRSSSMLRAAALTHVSERLVARHEEIARRI